MSTHTCAVLDTGQLRCWGDNGFGHLGQGNNTSVGDSPGETTVAVDLGPGRTAVAATAGEYHTCAVLDTRQLRCWGRNGMGSWGRAASSPTVPMPARPLPDFRRSTWAVSWSDGDTDGDGVRDAVDACRAVPGTLPNGCPRRRRPSPRPC